MPQIMSVHDWLKLTDGGMTSVRSTELKAIDEALKQYHASPDDTKLGSVQGALLKWMQKQGKDWKSSVRNKKNAVDSLYKQVAGLPGAPKTALGMIALSHARDESRAIVTNLFQGKQLVYRPGLLTKLAGAERFAKLSALWTLRGVASDANQLSGGAITKGAKQAIGKVGGGGGSAAAFADQVLRDLVPHDLFAEVTKVLVKVMPQFMQKWAAALTPFAGVVVSGAGVVAGAVTTLRSQWRASQAQMHAARTLSTAEPEQAMQAVVRMLQRERNAEVASLGVGVGEFGGKLAGVLADGGTATNAAVGLAAGVANLTILVHAVVRDVREKNAANKLMAKGTVNARLFEACPLMGAYLVCCAPTSVLVNTIFDDDRFYQPGMQDLVERAVARHVKPMMEQARRLVAEHRMHIPALANYPGVLGVNKANLEAMEDRKGKTAIGKDHIEGPRRA